MNLDYLIIKINNIITDFIQTIDEDYTSRVGSDFCALIGDEIIEWSLICSEKSATSFYNHFVSLFPQAKEFNLFTLSILHEVGHLETVNEMVDDVTERNTIKDCENYYNLHNEKIATTWAGYWIEDNYKQVKALDNKLEKIIKKFENSLDK